MTLPDQIEALIDAHGLYAVSQAIEQVCYAKASHLADHWQDSAAAKRWVKAGRAFDRTHTALTKIQLP